jgi:membrane protease YdiL (CAAX protease family)
MKYRFDRPKVRTFVLWQIVTSVAVFFVMWDVVFETTRIDPYLFAVVASQLSIATWSGWQVWINRIALADLFGRRPTSAELRRNVPLVALLIVAMVGGLYLLYYPLSFLFPELTESLVNATNVQRTGSVIDTIVVTFIVVVAAPVLEEITFRGLILHRWSRKWGTAWGVVMSSLLFGLLHANALGAGMVGVVLALVYLQTRSLWVPIAMHVVNNAVAMLADYMIPQSWEHISIDELRSTVWVGAVCCVVATIGLRRVVGARRHVVKEHPPLLDSAPLGNPVTPTEPDPVAERIERTSAYYDRFADDVARRIERRDFTRALDAFCALVVPGGPILDIGSGAGAHLAEFRRRGFDAIGIEPSARMREIAGAQGLRVIDGSFEELPWLELPPAGGVWCAASLLHVPADEIPGVLVDIRERLAPGAPLFATVRLGSGASWDRFDDTASDDARFIQLFEDGALERMVETAGFAVLEQWTEESTWGRPSTWTSILAQKPG